jgi:hypothetical protein
MAKPTAAATESTKTAAAPKAVIKEMLVLDTTATPESPKRTHEMMVDGIVKPFTFEHGKPLALPEPVAIKFLKHAAFWRVDGDGNKIEYQRRPKQPDELEAGEQLTLTDEQTVANLDELSNVALQKRAMEMPGGEKFAVNPSRAAMIKFMVDVKRALREANTSREREVGPNDFVPEANFDEKEAA